MPTSRVTVGWVSVLAGMLAVLAGSFLVLAVPARAADKTLSLSFTCAGGPFSTTSMTVPLTVPDTASGTFDVEWSLPALTLRTAPTTATQVQATGKLVVTGGTHTDLSKTGASVTPGSTSVLAAKVTSKVTVTATTGGQVTIKPSTEQGSLKLGLAGAPAEVTSCTTTGTESVVVTVGTGGDGGGTGTGTQVVEYTCTSDSGTVQDVKIKVTLTLPATNPETGVQFSIGWTGVYEAGAELKAPAGGLPAGVKLYTYASISGMSGALTSATGVGTLGTITAGQTIPLPATAVSMKTTSQRAGTAQVKPAAVNIGQLPTSPLIECEVKNPDTLDTYPLTIGAGSSSTPSETPSETPSSTPSSTATSESPEPTRRNSSTPKDGVDTGAGGEAGPDGRAFVLTGSALIMAAGVGGLLLRRRTVTRS
ncbi:hypothetical protein [Nonomuraea sp. NPDC048916]|uniref:hypothetical protein n=1 Tax=Nonomuraea sp. NPDC048916 TaxID=3154232 RepID=UPI0033F0BC88